jgi:hypothetical protein
LEKAWVKINMSAPTGHDWSRKPVSDDDEEDPVITMIEKTGCIEYHYKIQVTKYINVLKKTKLIRK